MRGHSVCLAAILIIAPSTLWAASNGIPTLDVRPVCRGIAGQSADPGVGQRDQTETFKQCMESEEAVREQLKQVWSAFSAADKRHCVTLATTGGESSNTELLTCLEMARDVRVLRSASSGKETTKPSSSLSMPEPAATGPIAEKEAPKKEDNEAKSEVERAKAEAQIAKASEVSAQRNLADAEAALKKAKEEAQRATAEVEQAKAEAQNARESEAAVKRKLADAEAARAKAEQACRSSDTTRPGLGGRLRRWLGRPGTPNP